MNLPTLMSLIAHSNPNIEKDSELLKNYANLMRDIIIDELPNPSLHVMKREESWAENVTSGVVEFNHMIYCEELVHFNVDIRLCILVDLNNSSWKAIVKGDHRRDGSDTKYGVVEISSDNFTTCANAAEQFLAQYKEKESFEYKFTEQNREFIDELIAKLTLVDQFLDEHHMMAVINGNGDDQTIRIVPRSVTRSASDGNPPLRLEKFPGYKIQHAIKLTINHSKLDVINIK